jgi:hypothetical protein
VETEGRAGPVRMRGRKDMEEAIGVLGTEEKGVHRRRILEPVEVAVAAGRTGC